jgi:hypothetical protein
MALDAIAVEFDLVPPALARGDMALKRGELRLDESGKRRVLLLREASGH